jgi:hypothetical protein
MRTKKNSLIIVISSFRTVFSRLSYIILAIIAALLFFLLAIWLPNLSFLKHIAVSDTYSFSSKITIFWSSLGFIETNFTTVTRILTIIVIFLSGVNISLLGYYLKNRIKLERAVGTGILGSVAGLLGVGCTSCGSVLLSSIFGLSATVGFIGILPLQGAEFGLAGIIILSFSIYMIAKKIQNPLVCKINN